MPKHLTTTDAAEFVTTTQVGAVNGIAQLGADGKVPTGQLPAAISNPVLKVNGHDGPEVTLTTDDVGALALATADGRYVAQSSRAAAGGVATLDSTAHVPVAQVPDLTGTYVRANSRTVSVKDAPYSAVGNGTADDTTALNTAISDVSAAGGGRVYLPPGTYRITSALTMRSNVELAGAGAQVSVVHQATASADALSGADLQYVTVQDVGFTGPGSGTGSGINFSVVSATATLYLSMRNVHVQGFGGDGLKMDLPIVSSFSRVVAESCGGWGFNFFGHTTGAQPPGTSCVLTSCYGNGCTTGGFRMFKMAYTSLVGCAADNNATGYLVDTGYAVALVGCGSEGNTTGVEVSGGYGVSVQGMFVYNNVGVGIWVTGSAHTVGLYQVSDVTPGAGATNFLKVDAGSFVTIVGQSNTTANALNGTVNVLDDGANGVVLAGYSFVNNTLEVKSDVLTNTGNVVISTAGKGLKVKEGTNARMGTAVLVAGTVTVSTTAVTATSRIFLTNQVLGGTAGFLRVSARTAGTSFTITSSSGTDTSTVAWMMVEPA